MFNCGYATVSCNTEAGCTLVELGDGVCACNCDGAGDSDGDGDDGDSGDGDSGDSGDSDSGDSDSGDSNSAPNPCAFLGAFCQCGEAVVAANGKDCVCNCYTETCFAEWSEEVIPYLDRYCGDGGGGKAGDPIGQVVADYSPGYAEDPAAPWTGPRGGTPT